MGARALGQERTAGQEWPQEAPESARHVVPSASTQSLKQAGLFPVYFSDQVHKGPPGRL